MALIPATLSARASGGIPNESKTSYGTSWQIYPVQSAGMAKLVDALRSGRSEGNLMGVQLSLPALCNGTRPPQADWSNPLRV